MEGIGGYNNGNSPPLNRRTDWQRHAVVGNSATPLSSATVRLAGRSKRYGVACLNFWGNGEELESIRHLCVYRTDSHTRNHDVRRRSWGVRLDGRPKFNARTTFRISKGCPTWPPYEFAIDRTLLPIPSYRWTVFCKGIRAGLEFTVRRFGNGRLTAFESTDCPQTTDVRLWTFVCIYISF